MSNPAPIPPCWKCGAQQNHSSFLGRVFAWAKGLPSHLEKVVEERERKRWVRKLQGENVRLRAIVRRQGIDPDHGVVCYVKDVKWPRPDHWLPDGTPSGGPGVVLITRSPDDMDEAKRLDSELRRMACPRGSNGGLLRAPRGLLLLDLNPPKED